MDLGDIGLSGKSFALPAQGFSKEGRKERCNEPTFRKWLFRLLNNYNILPKILQKNGRNGNLLHCEVMGMENGPL